MIHLEELLARIAKGDRQAFRSLHDRTAAALFAVIVRILIDPGKSEDVLQVCFMQIWAKAGSYDAGRGRPMTWLMTIARNGAIDRHRTRSSRLLVELDRAHNVSDPSPCPDVLVFAANEARLIDRLISGLPVHVAATIRATYFEGATYKELADRNQISIGTLKSWTRRGLQRMRAEYSSLGWVRP